MLAWLAAFAFTQAVEIPIYGYALRDLQFSRFRTVVVAFGASAITHPFVWFLFPAPPLGSYLTAILVSETFAVAVEAAYLRTFGVKLYVSWSLVANAFSFGLGILSQNLVGWP